MKVLAWLKSWVVAPDYRDDAAWKKEKEWCRTLTFPEVDRDSARVAFEYAEKRYGMARSLFDSLDGKADSIFRFAATMAGAVFVVSKAVSMSQAASVSKAANVPMSNWLVTAYLLFLFSILLTIITRRPGPIALPTPTRNVLMRLKNANADLLLLEMAASYHVCGKGVLRIASWKAAQLKRENWLFLFGLICLLIGLIKPV